MPLHFCSGSGFGYLSCENDSDCPPRFWVQPDFVRLKPRSALRLVSRSRLRLS